MSSDPKSYYSDFGVSPTASLDEIKTLYRALAKIYHPDINKDRAAAEKFKKINAAYEVLSDERKRAEYDRSGTTSQSQTSAEARPQEQSPQKEPVAPVQCSKCGTITAQPRFLIFRQVISFLLITRTTQKPGVYCSECAKKVAFRASAISAAFGWWAFPWGPLLTVKEIFRNAVGGERKPELDEQLNWQNALAFLDRGKYELSASLAQRLTNSKDRQIADNAKQLSTILRDRGFKGGRLKSPWSRNIGTSLVQLVMGAIVPLIAWGIFTQATASSYQSPVRYTPAPTTSTASNRSATTPAATIAPKPMANLCRTMPVNNRIFEGSRNLLSSGHSLTIKNGSAGNAIIKVRVASTGRLLLSFFARQDMSATVEGIPDGNYRIQFAYGDAMNAACSTFLDAQASEFDGIQRLATEHKPEGVYTSVLSFTLYRVAGGNISQDDISAASFDQP